MQTLPSNLLITCVWRIVLSLPTTLLFLNVGGVFQKNWGNGALIAACSFFVLLSVTRLLLVSRGKWGRATAVFFDLSEIGFVFALSFLLVSHLKESPRFLLQPFSYAFLSANLIFAAAQRGRAGLWQTAITTIGLRIALLAYCGFQGVIFTTEYAYLDRFIFWGQEIVWILGWLATSVAVLTWQTNQVKVNPSGIKREPLTIGGPAQVAPAQKAGPEIRTAFLLFIDIRDFAKLSSHLSPGQVKRMLREYHDHFEAAITRHGGSVERREGDGILAHFGIQKNEGNAAARGMTCLEELLGVLDTWNEERVTHNECLVECGFAGVVANFFFEKKGNNDRLDLNLVGESVNLIQRLEKHNKVINAKAATTRQTLEMASAQGFVLSSYVRSLPKEKIEDLAFKLDIVVLAERSQQSKIAA